MNKLQNLVRLMIFCMLPLAVSALESEPVKSKNSSKAQIITIETATIRGNQELPTVLYLVPWQPPKVNALEASQTADMTRNSIELIDRNSFRRLVEYHQKFEKTP